MKAFALLLCVLACSQTSSATRDKLEATCDLVGNVTGTLSLRQRGSSLTVKGTLRNITVGVHAIHVHQNGSVANNCIAAGPHYNPENVDHGAISDATRHAGDWGNFNARRETYRLKIRDRVAKLDGPSSILGRAIVIHGGRDDLGRGNNTESKLNGNAGPRIACCVIQSTQESF